MRIGISLRTAATLVLLSLLLCGASPVQAQGGTQEAPQVSLSETSLHFRGQAGESLQRTLTLSTAGGAVEQVTVVRHDLLDAGTGVVILSEQVTVEPEAVDNVEGVQLFTVTVQGGVRAGHYVGTVEFHYLNQPETAPLVVTLDVTLDANSQVDADVSSKSLVMEVVPSGALPLGRPKASPESPPRGHVTVSLVQAGEGPAQVIEGTVLALVGPGNQTLPAGAVSVATSLPLTIEGRGSANVELVARGERLGAGEYDGTVHLNVRNQAPVQVPLKVLVKDGPLLPVLVLTVAPVMGLIIALWNRDGKERYSLYRRLARMDKRLQSPPPLVQADELEQARRDLEAAKDRLVDGDELSDITAQLDALETALTAARQAAQKLLDEETTPLEGDLRGVQVGRTYRDKMIDAVRDSKVRLQQGTFQNILAARSQVAWIKGRYDDLRAAEGRFQALEREDQQKIQARVDAAQSYKEIDDLVTAMTKVADSVQAVPEAFRAQVQGWIDATHSLEEARALMARVQEVFRALAKLPAADGETAGKALLATHSLEEWETAVSLPPGKAPAGPRDFLVGSYEKEVVREEALAAPAAWERAGLKLRWQRFGVFGIVYIFTLVVGWITLYVAAPTFGADPREYVTLFLWGVSATTVGAQAISLQGIFDRAHQQAGGDG